MGSSEADKSTKEKEAKAAPASTPEQSSTTSGATGTVNAEWPGFQAYSPMPPHGYLASSPQAPPYMWGVQHIMPPYGTPPHPYVAMYPHGGIYAHPGMPPGSYPFSPFAMPSPNGVPEGAASANVEADGKPSEGKEKLPIKRSKGSLGSLNVITGKNNNDIAKSSGTSANGAYSKSADSGSEGSSEGSDDNSQNDSQLKSGGGHDSVEEVSQNGKTLHVPQNGGPNAPHVVVKPSMAIVPITAGAPPGGVPGPATNLNIGMDYWGTPTSTAIPARHGKVPHNPHDERELKRQRRKQSNRESARRSRLRKQAECDELAHHADALKDENSTLRAELNCIRSEYEKLLAENTSLKERLGEVPGHEDGRSDKNINHDSQQTTD